MVPQLGNRLHFQEELQRLEEQALTGIDLVARTLDRTREAVREQDVELASLVIADDDLIDGLYLQVHQGVLSLMALQAPVATDLRLVAAILDVIKHIERMGDGCVNVAKLIPLAGNEPPRQPGMVEDLDRMAVQAKSQVLQAGDDADTREWAMTMMLMARAIERIGDNAVDIGEQVAFVVTGLFREFTDASHPEAVPPGAAT